VGRRKRAELSEMDQDDEPVSLSQGAKFGTFALSTTISPRVRLFDRHPQDFHFPVFYDSGNADRCEERKISRSAKGANMPIPRLAPPIKGLISLSDLWTALIFARIQWIRTLAKFY